MTWEEAKLTLQLEAERAYGAAVRRTQELARASEDVMAARISEAHRGSR